MKKQYMKPAVFAESFRMAEHIATGCLMDTKPDGTLYNKPTYGSGMQDCAMLMGGDEGMNFFQTGMACDWTTEDTNLNCYNSFLTAGVAFSS